MGRYIPSFVDIGRDEEREEPETWESIEARRKAQCPTALEAMLKLKAAVEAVIAKNEAEKKDAEWDEAPWLPCDLRYILEEALEESGEVAKNDTGLIEARCRFALGEEAVKI